MSQKTNIDALCSKEINILNVCWRFLCFHLNPMTQYPICWELTCFYPEEKPQNIQFPHSIIIILVSHSPSAKSPPPKHLGVFRNSSPFNLPDLCQDCYQRVKQFLVVCPSGLSCTDRPHWVFSPMTNSEYLLPVGFHFGDLYCFINEMGNSIRKMSVVESHY